MSDWTYQGVPITSLPECAGFVYLITHLATNKRYIGKKLASFKTTRYKTIKLKNGTKRKQKIKSTTESDWQSYFGSSLDLKADVKTYGPDAFTREILMFCKTKGECSYYEAKYQFDYDVLLSPNFYNKQISCRIHHTHL